MKARKCSVVAGLAMLSIALVTQSAVALEPVGVPQADGLRSGWYQVFTQTDTKFDHIQFLMVDGGPQGVVFEGLDVVADPNAWCETYNDGMLLTADAKIPGGTSSLTFKLRFSGTASDSIKFYYQVFGHQDDSDPYSPVKILSEDTVTWLPAPLYDWNFVGGTPWADVRIDCSTPPVGELHLVGPVDCIVDPNEVFYVEIEMRDVTEGIIGGQYFLEYDNAKLDYAEDVGIEEVAPFTQQIKELVNEGTGIIDYANAIPFDAGDPPVSGTATLARIPFRARQQVCIEAGANLVTFRQHVPWTRLSKPGGETVWPLLFEMEPIVLDWSAPVFDPSFCWCSPSQAPGCDPNNPIIVECDELDTLYPVYDPNGVLLADLNNVATDNCTDPNDIVYTFDEDRTYEDPNCQTFFMVRTWRAMDECGNYAECVVYFQVQDTTGPQIKGCPVDDTVIDCTSPLLDAPFANVTATDNCSGAVVTWEDIPADHPTSADLGDPNVCFTFEFTRKWTAVDACGNQSCCWRTITVVDNDPPVLDPNTLPQDKTIPCTDYPPAEEPLFAEDDCSGTIMAYPVDVESEHDSDCWTFNITRTWTFTDACGNQVSHTQVITVVDDVDPELVNVPQESTIVVECDQVPEPAPIAATDNCDTDPQLTFREVRIDGNCPQSYTLKRTWTATDGCGNYTSYTRMIIVEDTMPPYTPDDPNGMFVCESLIEVYPDLDPMAPDYCWVRVCPQQPPAVDNCDEYVEVTGVRDDYGSLCGYYPAFDGEGNPTETTITWTAEDDCGNTAVCQTVVKVIPYIPMHVRIDEQMYKPGVQLGLERDRCITFDLYNCAEGRWAEVEATLTFAAVEGPSGTIVGRAEGEVMVPCGDWTCIQARDAMHTLRVTLQDTGAPDSPFRKDPIAGRYVADFVAGGKLLLAGNLNDDCYIDILDFAAFSSVFGETQALDTGCDDPNLALPHADFSGWGTVFTEDFVYIGTNFLAESEMGCCGDPCPACPPNCGPNMSVSVGDLHDLGLGNHAAADLNQDGYVDTQDVVEFMNGARPVQEADYQEVQSSQRQRAVR